MTKKITPADRDTNLFDFHLKIKGVGKLSVTFDARSRIEKMFLKIVDILADQAEEAIKEI